MSLLDGDASDIADFRRSLREATHSVGFFYLVGHGIGDEEIARMFAVASEFFALDDDAKREVEMTRSPHFRGYTRDFWREREESPAEQDYHYNRNAETYLLVGEAMGRAMARRPSGQAARWWAPGLLHDT